MVLSLRTIFRFIQWKDYQSSPSLDWEKTFADVFLLETEMEQLDEDILYVADLDTLTRYFAANPQRTDEFYGVCLAENPDEVIPFSHRIHWIYMPKHHGSISVFNEFRHLFYRFQAWDRKLDQIILSGQGMDAMLAAYTEILPHHLLVWDASFNICAYTKEIQPPNLNVAKMEEKGYFFREMVEELIGKNLIANTTNMGTRFLSGNVLPSGNSALLHHYFRQGLRFYTLCVYCGENPKADLGAYDLTEYFFKRFNLYLDKNAPVFKEQRFLYESFLVSILERKLIDVNVIEEKAEIFHIQCETESVLYCIQFMEYNPTIARYLMETFPNTSPNVKFFQHNGMILMLKSRECRYPFIKAQEEGWQERITRLLIPNQAFCGISTPFFHLKELPTAYNQACAALQFGLMFQKQKAERLYFYREFYLYHMFQCVQDSLGLDSLYLKKFDELMEGDIRRNTNNMHLLRVYLENNQAVTATAKEMYMHRNSVIYRIHRIEEILEVSLEDHQDVFRVNYSLKLIKYLAWTRKEYEKYRCLME